MIDTPKNVDKYVKYLESFIDPEECHKHLQLVAVLRNTEFYSPNEYDEARGADGLDLRERFYEDFPNLTDEDGTFEGYPTVFEVMVAMAIRCEEDIMYDVRFGDRTAKWFWMMIDNLGLSFLDNKIWTPESENYIKVVIEKCLDRRYGENGIGSFWPRPRNNILDWTNLPIWFQLQYYMNYLDSGVYDDD